MNTKKEIVDSILKKTTKHKKKCIQTRLMKDIRNFESGIERFNWHTYGREIVWS
jgi:hypothetical protein